MALKGFDQGRIRVSDNDDTSEVLDNKISAGDGLAKSITSEDGDEILDLDVMVKNSLEIDSDSLQLVNDDPTPNGNEYYGTNNSSTKGFFDLPDVLGVKSIAITKSIVSETETSDVELVNDETSPGNSKFFGTTTLGIKGWQDLPIKNTIKIDSDELIQLDGDVLAPGTEMYYGTDSAGTKGFYSLPQPLADVILEGIHSINATIINVDSAGVTYIDMSLVNDELAPGNKKFYGTNAAGTRGWYFFDDYVAPRISVSSVDTTGKYLTDKLLDGDGILKTITDPAGDEVLNISVKTKNTIEIDSDSLQLVNDELTPGNNYFYGTNAAGAKGWYNALQGDLDLGIYNIVLDPIPDSNLTSSGISTSMQVDVNSTGVAAALHMDLDINWIEANATLAITMPCGALALETGTGVKKVLLLGFIRNETWAWIPGGLIYVDTSNGSLTQTVPTTIGEQVQVVGFATHADRMFFNPSYAILEN